MKKLLFCLAICNLAFLSGCKPDGTQKPSPSVEISERERTVIETMKWVDSQDPQDAAKKAAKAKECVFLATANRAGVSLPAVSTKVAKQAIEQNQYRVLEGMGDVIYGAIHKNYRTKTQNYMEVYNGELEAQCFN